MGGEMVYSSMTKMVILRVKVLYIAWANSTVKLDNYFIIGVREKKVNI